MNRIMLLGIGLIILLSGCATRLEPAEEMIEAQKAFVVINEVASTGEYEFVELFNLSSNPIVFSQGWLLTDDTENFSEEDTPFIIPEGTRIEGYGYLLICPFERQKAEEVLNDQSIPQEALLDISFSLGSSDALMLYADGVLVDSYTWDHDLNSAGRIPDGIGEFSLLLSRSPGQANSLRKMKSTPSLQLNELCSKDVDYVELYNPTSREAVIGKQQWALSDSSMEEPDYLEEGMRVPAKGFLVIYTEDLSFGLGKGDSVYLYHEKSIVDHCSYSGHADSLGRIGSSLEWVATLKSPGEPNERSE